jgi:hypothetical protein
MAGDIVAGQDLGCRLLRAQNFHLLFNFISLAHDSLAQNMIHVYPSLKTYSDTLAKSSQEKHAPSGCSFDFPAITFFFWTLVKCYLLLQVSSDILRFAYLLCKDAWRPDTFEAYRWLIRWVCVVAWNQDWNLPVS